MPMMPIEPANEVRIVRDFLVARFLSESIKAVTKDMAVFFL